MPYVFVEVLDEGQEEADVVERSQFEEVLDSLHTAESMRDSAIQRAEQSEKDLAAQKRKYAETFLSKPPVATANVEPSSPQFMPQTFDDLLS